MMGPTLTTFLPDFILVTEYDMTFTAALIFALDFEHGWKVSIEIREYDPSFTRKYYFHLYSRIQK